MEALQLLLSSSATDSALASLISNVVLSCMTEYFGVCVIRSQNDSTNFNIPTPSLAITVDASFLKNFQKAIDGGCQAFVVQNQAIWPFLDSFVPAHDLSDQRFSGKKLVAVLDGFDEQTIDRLCKHHAVKDLPEILIIVSHTGRDIELYTTHMFSKRLQDAPVIEVVPITSSNYFPSKINDLEGLPIRFQTVMYPPYSYFEKTTIENANAWSRSQNGTDLIPIFIDGQESLILVEFCHKYNCTIEILYDDDMWGEVFENQTGTGSLGAVAMHKADITLGAIYYLLDLYKFTTLTVPLSRSGLTVVVPKASILAPWKTPFLSFSGSLWMAVAASYVVGVFFICVVEKVQIKILEIFTKNAKTASDAALMMIALFIEQGINTRQRDLASSTLLFGSLLFAGFMIGNIYSAGLAGIMTIPQYGQSIDTVQDLATSGLPWGGTAIAWIFAIETATEAYLKTIVNNYKVVELETLMQYAKFGNFGFVGERTEFGHFVPIDYLDQESSQMLKLLRDDLSWENCAAVVSKTSPIKLHLDELIMNIRQSGVQFYWESMAANKYLNMTHEKNILNGRIIESEKEAKQLTLFHFLGAFLILGSGVVIGSVFFVFEVANKSFARIRLRNKLPQPAMIVKD